MKRKKLLWQALPLVIVIIFLALPSHTNHALRNTLGSFCSTLRRVFCQTHVPSSDLKALQLKVWQLEEENRALREGLASAPLQPLTAKVIFRTYGSWSSSLWIDKGSSDNHEGVPLLAKNSPVLSGDSVVGIIDYVGKHVSLVRLITDSGMYPAVRVARQSHYNDVLQKVATLLESKELSFEKAEEKTAFVYLLGKLQKETEEAVYLAKGELQGHSEPVWRSPGKLLQGIGFNYDWKDDEGPARDLRTGEPQDPDKEYTSRQAVPLIQRHDLLVTTGFDGLFPAGLKVATVESILPLKEGDYAYEMRARPTAENMLDLEYVSILSPQKVQREPLPDRVGRILEQIDSVK